MADQGDVEAIAASAADGAASAADTASDLINNPETQALIGEGFGELDKAYSMSVTEAKQGMMIASGLASAGCMALLPLLRVEIFRDFSQLMGVVFGSAYADAKSIMYVAVSAFGGAFNILTLQLGAAFQTKEAAYAGFIIVFVLGILSILLYVWLVCISGVADMAEDEVRMGNEAEEFVVIAKRKKNTVWIATQTITLSVSAYLPVCQVVAQIIFCDKESYIIKQNDGNCSNDNYTGLVGICVVLIIVFILPLPIFLYMMIERFKPKGSPKNPEIVYDQDGEEVPFDDKVYNELVEHDINQQLNPFRSLYQGFEKKNSQWKVGLMVYKVFFVLPTIILSSYSSLTAVAVFQLILICLNFVASTALSPYIDPLNDQMDFDGRLCAVIVGIGGVVTAAVGDSAGASDGMGIIVFIANALNGLSMILIMCAGIPFVSETLKNTRGKFTWSDTSRGLEGLSAKQAIELYDIKKEVKHRVWQTWWNGVLLNKCGDDVPGRVVELQKDTIDNGIATIRNHWNGEKIEKVRQNRMRARTEFEGVDMYWDDATGTRDGTLDSKSFFGKMYVKPYPFHIVMVYGDADDETFIEDDDMLEKFIQKQEDSVVSGKRQRRRKFRALSAEGCAVRFPFTREEVDHNVPDGSHSETYTDNDGNSHTKTVQDYSDVHIMITYTMGTVAVKSNYPSKAMQCGFNATMDYSDGCGSATKPRTGEPYNVSNRHTQMGAEHMGISDSWEETSAMSKLFSASECGPAFDKQIPIFEQELADYRQGYIDRENEKNKILGAGFWYYVYNAPTLTRDALTAYLTNSEANPILKAIPDNEAAGLDYLYKRMALVNRDDKTAMWFVFWEDFWLNNGEMSIIAPLADCFDPTKPKAICYHYMERQELERFLKQNDLMHKDPDSFCVKYGCAKVLFLPSDLDWLYLRLNGEPLPESDEARRKRQASALLGMSKSTEDSTAPTKSEGEGE